jgi:hypothetical protein
LATLLIKLVVSQFYSLVVTDDCRVGGMFLGHFKQLLADGFGEESRVAVADGVGKSQFGIPTNDAHYKELPGRVSPKNGLAGEG